MKIDLSCPVELWQYSLPTEATPECTFLLNNLSDRVVASVQVTLVCEDEAGDMLFRQIERVQGLSAGAGERFSLVILPTKWEGVAGVELIIEKVWYDDASVWRLGNEALTEYEPNALPAGRKLDELKFVAGADATGYPVEQAHAWVCVCGRPNALDSAQCCRCARRRDAVMASFRQENVAQLIAVHEKQRSETARKAREDASKLAEARERERQRKHKRRRKALATTITLLAVAALAFAAIFWLLPEMAYRQADEQLTQGQYDEAKAAFLKLGAYRDAAERAVDSDYQKASAALEAGGEENLLAAKAGFEKLSDYRDSPALTLKATYRLGESALAAEAYDKAEERFAALEGYEDSAERVLETRYLRADALLARGAYEQAREQFLPLAGYRDADDKALRCDDALGQAAMEAGDYQQAIERFTLAGTYEGASERLKAACYALAGQRYDEGAYEEAGTLYQQAGDHEDAQSRANDCLYQLARVTMDAGDYEKAAQILDRIIPYLNSETMRWQCVYQIASAARESEDYERAAELFDSIPLHADAKERAMESKYLLAVQKLDAGDLESAELLLSQTVGYADTAKQLRRLRYQRAELAVSQGDWETAAGLFKALGSYADSKNQLKECNYQLALAAQAQGRYEDAATGFQALGRYRDSATKLSEARLGQAAAMEAAGDAAGALALLKTLDGNAAAAELRRIVMAQAEAARGEDDLEKASELYRSLPNDSEAKTLWQGCQYELASRAEKDGDALKAGALFAALGAYTDAAERSKSCYDSIYGTAATAARAAFKAGDDAAAVAALDGVALQELPADYADLQKIYEQACYRYAEKLYDEGQSYEALPYYQRIPDYRDVSKSKLTRACYLLLGTWRTADGRTVAFRADGTCTIFGEEFYFRVSNRFSLETGATPDKLTLTHKLSRVDQRSLSLRDMRDGRNIVAYFTRVSEATPEATAAPEETAAPSEATTTPAPSDTPAPTTTPAPTAVPTPTGAVDETFIVTDDI